MTNILPPKARFNRSITILRKSHLDIITPPSIETGSINSMLVQESVVEYPVSARLGEDAAIALVP
jgi:hypothetical protein